MNAIRSFVLFPNPLNVWAILREWWDYRELLVNLVARDIKVPLPQFSARFCVVAAQSAAADACLYTGF